jgi:hypothetical protein
VRRAITPIGSHEGRESSEEVGGSSEGLATDRGNRAQQAKQRYIVIQVIVVTFCPKVTAKDNHVTPPPTVIDKSKQTWAGYTQSWLDYRKSLTPEPEHVPEADKDTEEYGPEPDYNELEELQIACLVSTHNDSWLNNNTAESLLDSPLDLIYATTGQIKIT